MRNKPEYRCLTDHLGIEPRRLVALATPLILSTILTLYSGESARGQCQTGAGLFDYGPHRNDAESEQLAMTVTGQLRAPDYEYDRIHRDLGLIRSTFSFLTAVVDDRDYAANQLIVGMDTSLPWSDYEALNHYYQVIEDEVIFINPQIRLLTFCDNLNAHALATQYEPLPEVRYAEPNFTFGTDDRITITLAGDLYRYTIRDGFGDDCSSGCLCSRTWVVDVTASGTVQLVSYADSGGPACAPPPIPAVGTWGLIILSLLLLTAGQLCMERRDRESRSCEIAISHALFAGFPSCKLAGRDSRQSGCENGFSHQQHG